MPVSLLFADSRAVDLDLEREIAGPDILLVNARKGRLAEIGSEALATCSGVVVNRVPIDAAALPLLRRCAAVVRSGVGFDIVDLRACGEAGIAVFNVPDYCTTEVANSAISMMLAFSRGTAAFDAALRADLASGWSYTVNTTARRLDGAVAGIVGLGRIGTAVALRAKSLGMHVIFYDPYRPNGTEASLGLSRAASLPELLSAADVVTLHAPLNSETAAMIDHAAIDEIKPGSYLLNTARGALCNTSAILRGLREDRLLAVGLDVLPNEPATLDDPLVAAWRANDQWIRGRVLLGPHAGFFSPVALAELRRKTCQTAVSYLLSGTLANCVNSDYLDRDAARRRRTIAIGEG